MEKNSHPPSIEELNKQAIHFIQKGLLANAEELLRTAITVKPDDFQTLCNLGCLYCEYGKPAKAEVYFRRAIKAKPNHEMALNNLGHTLMLLDKASEAEIWFKEACKKDPKSKLSHYNLATAHLKQERWEEANQELFEVLKLDPGDAEAIRGLGLVKMGQGAPDSAKKLFIKAIQLNPNFTEAWYELGTAYMDLKEWQEAQSAFVTALQQDPSHKDASINLSQVLLEQNELEDAQHILQELVRIHQKDWRCWFNLGQYFYQVFRFQDAVEAFEKATELNNTRWEVLNALGITLHEAGKFKQANITLRKALKMCPTAADAHWNLSLTLLSQGHFSEGWKEYEWRWKRDSFPSKKPHTKSASWNGQKGTLCLHTEQGYGDNIQFVRLISLAKKLCKEKVVLISEKPLTRLFEKIKGLDESLPKEGAWEKFIDIFDYHLPLLSLPNVLKSQVNEALHEKPYITCSNQLKEHWKNTGAFTDSKVFKIGVAWEGNLNNKKGLKRSIPTEIFLEWLDRLKGCAIYYCLQPEKSGEIFNLPSGKRIRTLPHRPADFADTAGFIDYLDLIISVDTAIAHLAGALGKDLYLLLCAIPDWRWINGDSPNLWYPNARIYQQTKPGDWSTPLQLLQGDLEERLCSLQGGK